jgi:type II secretory pathway component PulK
LIRKKNNRRGSAALILVLITLSLLTVMVTEIMYRAKVSATVVTNRRDGEKAYELARAAVRWGIFRLQLDNALDLIPEIPSTNYGGKKDDLSEVQWAVPLPYPLPDTMLKSAEGSEEAKQVARSEDLGGSFSSAITDEFSKLNVNDVTSYGYAGQRKWSGTAEVLESLLLSPRFAMYFKNADHRALLWAMDDWTDADSEVNQYGGGIEDSEYQTDDKELHVKNGPFYSLEELRLLKPITDDLFNELKPFITVYPFSTFPRSNVNAPAAGRININTAPLELIAATLNRQVISEPRARLECAQAVLKYRKNVVFRKVKEDYLVFLSRQCGGGTEAGAPQAVTPEVQAILDVRSDIFSVEATGSVNDSVRTILAVFNRQDPQKPKPLFWKVM